MKFDLRSVRCSSCVCTCLRRSCCEWCLWSVPAIFFGSQYDFLFYTFKTQVRSYIWISMIVSVLYFSWWCVINSTPKLASAHHTTAHHALLLSSTFLHTRHNRVLISDSSIPVRVRMGSLLTNCLHREESHCDWALDAPWLTTICHASWEVAVRSEEHDYEGSTFGR